MKNYEIARAEFEKAKAEAEALAESLKYIVDEDNARREKFASMKKEERIMMNDYFDEYDEYELEREAEFEAIALLIREIEKQFPMDSIKRTVERMEAM